MPDGDPWYMRLLDKLGVNTTKLRWRLYRQEQQAKHLVEQGGYPRFLQWMRYPNKVCPHCRAINNRENRVCDSCGRRLPGMFMYRVRRMFNTILPEEGASVSMVFFALMILFYSVQLAMDGFGFQSMLAPSADALAILGAYRPGDPELGVWWRALGFAFVHGGLLHIGMNGYVLLQIGPMVEGQLRRGRMLVLITMGQIGSALACYLWYFRLSGEYHFIVGASGWLFGLIGFGILYAHRLGPAMRPMRDALIRWAVIVLVLGFVINMGGRAMISNAAHIGGLLGGFAFALLPESSPRHMRESDAAWSAAAWLCAVAWLLTLVMAVLSVAVNWPQLATQ